MSDDVNNGNANGPGVPKFTNCLERIRTLTANINNNEGKLFGAEEKVGETIKLFGYVSRVTTKQNNNNNGGNQWNVAAARTRNQKKNLKTTTTLQHMVIKSPNGPGSYNAINCGDYNKKFDPQESPFLIFTIDAEHFDLHNGKINMNKAEPITAQFYQQHGPEILDKFPVLYGKITQDDNDRTVAQTYELVKAGEKTVWRKSDTLINISDEIGMSKSNLCNGDEIQFTLVNDLEGNPFATNIVKISMDFNSKMQRGKLETYTYKCDLSKATIDTRVTNIVFETNTHGADAVTKMLSETQENKHLHFIPIPDQYMTPDEIKNQKFSKTRSCLTAGDICAIMKNRGMDAKWHSVDIDFIHLTFIEHLTSDQLTELVNNNFLTKEGFKAHWAFHYTNDNIIPVVNMMIQNDYNRNNSHQYILSTTVITKTQLAGRAAKINSKVECDKITKSWTNPNGLQIPLQAKNYDSKYSKVIKQTNIPNTTSTNLDLTFYQFTDDGHKQPLTNVETAVNTQPSGPIKNFTIYFHTNNEKVKSILRNATDSSVTGLKHLITTYPQSQRLNRPETLQWGRLRTCDIIVLTNATDSLITALNTAGAYITPADKGHSKVFYLRSKSHRPFPKELELLQQQFKHVQIIDRCYFCVYLKDTQDLDEIPSLLGLSKPSEYDSDVLIAPNNSSWSEIQVGNKTVAIGHIYEEKMPQKHNTFYVKNLRAIASAMWIQELLKKHTGMETNIVNSISETETGNNITVRYLKVMVQDPADKEYVMAISSNNSDFFEQLKEKCSNIYSKSNAKYDIVTTGINRLQHVLDVLSDAKEKTPSNISPEIFLRNYEAVNTASSSSSTNNHAPSKTVPKNKSTSRNQQGNALANSNKYGVLLDEENAEGVDRQPDPDDFNNTQDTLVKKWMEKSLSNTGKISKATMAKLHEATVKNIVKSTPDYHANVNLPTWFLQQAGKNKQVGFGRQLIQFFDATPTETRACQLVNALESGLDLFCAPTNRIGTIRKSIQKILDQNKFSDRDKQAHNSGAGKRKAPGVTSSDATSNSQVDLTNSQPNTDSEPSANQSDSGQKKNKINKPSKQTTLTFTQGSNSTQRDETKIDQEDDMEQ